MNEFDQPKILVVDDEEVTRLSLAEILSLEGYRVASAGSGEEALQKLEEETFDLVLADLVMKEVDGLQVMEAAKKLSPDTVVIMLTAYGTLESAIQAMRQGAYDYLIKPCGAQDIVASVESGLARQRQERRRRELVTRVEEMLRALKAQDETLVAASRGAQLKRARFLQAGEIIVDLQKHIATLHGQLLTLTPTEFRLLVCLMRKADRVFSCQELVREVQNYDCDEREARDIIRVHVRRLRQKIEPDPANPQYILNVRGVGYMFTSPPHPSKMVG
ncbi:MAG TPA: response regulator transcription factor [Anaerolineae bacterium]|nr:response regulator transcription factor [Anaerolineae bacterium]